MRSDMQADGHPTIVQFGTVSFTLIDRDGRKGVRAGGGNAATRTHFLGLDYFPIDRNWRVEAEWMPEETPRTLPIPTTLGAVREQPVLGKAVFMYGGRQYALAAVGARADHRSFVMADATSGRETYGGARFLTPDMTSDGRKTGSRSPSRREKRSIAAPHISTIGNVADLSGRTAVRPDTSTLRKQRQGIGVATGR
jgi:hypothetical protein